MPFTHIALLVLAAIALTGCQAPSLNPLHLSTDKLTLPALEGKWAEEKHQYTFLVKPPQEFNYEIEMRVKELSSPWKYDARLVKLRNDVFADILLTAAPEHFDGCIGCIPAHSFWKLNLAGDTMKPAYLDGSWLNKYLIAHPKSIAHVWTSADDEKIAILTAPTAALRAFVTKFAGDKDAMDEWETLHRCTH